MILCRNIIINGHSVCRQNAAINSARSTVFLQGQICLIWRSILSPDQAADVFKKLWYVGVFNLSEVLEHSDNGRIIGIYDYLSGIVCDKEFALLLPGLLIHLQTIFFGCFWGLRASPYGIWPCLPFLKLFWTLQAMSCPFMDFITFIVYFDFFWWSSWWVFFFIVSSLSSLVIVLITSSSMSSSDDSRIFFVGSSNSSWSIPNLFITCVLSRISSKSLPLSD